MALRPLNYFEKALIAQRNEFFTTCEMAARGKARYIANLESAPNFYNGVDFEKVQNFALSVITNGVGDQREFAKGFLQYHTGDIETNAYGVNDGINVPLLSQNWAVADADFDVYMDYVFKAKG